MKETKNSMVTVPTILVGEESEKEKRVTDAYRLFGQMRLRGTSLAKRAAAIVKHRVFVAQILRTQASLVICATTSPTPARP